MTYREWVRTEYPHVGVVTVGGIETAGIMYRRYVERETDMDPVEYFHMSNDKGFTDWLKGVWSQLKDTGMKATNRNKAILWHIYKKRSTARLVKFMDENLVLREFYNSVWFDEATKIDPEVFEQLQKRSDRGTTWLSKDLHDPKEFEKATKKFDPYGHKDLIDSDSIIPDHYGGKDDPYEAIKVINAWGLGFCLGNVLKYIKRTGKKGDPIEDLKKAKRYLELELEKYDIHG